MTHFLSCAFFLEWYLASAFNFTTKFITATATSLYLIDFNTHFHFSVTVPTLIFIQISAKGTFKNSLIMKHL